MSVGMSGRIFKLFTSFVWGIMFVMLIVFMWFEGDILSHVGILWLMFWRSVLWVITTLIWLQVYKTTKLSALLPYDNIDKLFIIVIGFFLYQWSGDQQTSLLTFFIAIMNLCVITYFSVDLKNISLPRWVQLHVFNKLLYAFSWLTVAYILLSYNFIAYGTINIIFETIIYVTFAIYLGDSFKSMFTQSKIFYKNRFACNILWYSGFIISLFLVQNLGIVIASLLGFLSIVFNIIAMKVVLNDTPSRKQILLAVIVTFLIGIGYYFK